MKSFIIVKLISQLRIILVSKNVFIMSIYSLPFLYKSIPYTCGWHQTSNFSTENCQKLH